MPGIPKQLEHNLSIVVTLHFDREWCEKFFTLSEDQNISLHTQDNGGIVQGVAIMTKIGTLLSVHLQGYLVHHVTMTFKKVIRIGESVTVLLSRKDNKKAVTHVAVLIRDSTGGDVAEAMVHLVTQKILSRAMTHT